MNEDFLHYVWQQKLFAPVNLKLTDGKPVQLVHPGYKNSDAGPDFSMCKITIDGTEWVGDAEIHLKSSDWIKHTHHQNPAYNKVILHVVWQHDKEVYAADGHQLPCLELRELIQPELLQRYHDLMRRSTTLACDAFFADTDTTVKYAMMDRMLIDRLEEKAGEAAIIHKAVAGDKEETAWHLVCKTFGFKTNADAMIKLAGIVPYKVLRKHRDKLFDIEALLYGCAGFLRTPCDEYSEKLQKEYEFLAHKYQLKGQEMRREEWKFMRMRPQNFPTVRLAQLAALVHRLPALHGFLIDITHTSQLYELNLSPGEYAQSHYDFSKPSKSPMGAPGKTSLNSLIINAAAPLMVLEALHSDNRSLTDRATQLLEQLPAEDNRYTRAWQPYGLIPTNAGEAQALLQWHKRKCALKKCLDCLVGHRILHRKA